MFIFCEAEGRRYGDINMRAGKEIMSVKEFAEKVRKAAQEILGEEYYLEVQQHLKVNETPFISVNVHNKSSNISPVIYMESFHREYEEGRCFGDIMSEFMRVYWDSVPAGEFDMDFIKDFELVKERLTVHLINFEKNKKLLEDAYFERFLDLAAVYYIDVESGKMGSGCIMVRKEFLEGWNVTGKELMKAVIENDARKKDMQTISMASFFKEIYKEKFCDDSLESLIDGELYVPPIWIMTNAKKVYGAKAMIMKEHLSDFAKTNNSNFFIIPSSVHEIIAVPDDMIGASNEIRRERCDELKQMIAMVNKNELSPEEFLSDNLYYYDRDLGEVAIG